MEKQIIQFRAKQLQEKKDEILAKSDPTLVAEAHKAMWDKMLKNKYKNKYKE